MGSVNKVTLIGNLGKDPEVRTTQGGTKVASMSLATSETYVKDGKKEEKVEWHRLVMWDKLADLAEKYLKKGKKIYVEGKLATRQWEDKDGAKRYTTEINVLQMVFLDSAGGSGQGRDPGPSEPPPNTKSKAQPQQQSKPADYGEPFNEDSDVPF